MSAGHKHREVKVSRNGLVCRVLTRPIWWETDIRRVALSKYPYGQRERTYSCKTVTAWYLSPLSILHRWTGLTLLVDEP